MNLALSQMQALQFQAAAQALSARKPQVALHMAQQLVREAPGAADAHQLLAMCLGENGRNSEAESAFERAIALAPNSPVIAQNFALFLTKQGKLQRTQNDFIQAVKSLRRAVQIDAQRGSAWAELGLALRLCGNVEAALEAFQQAKALGINTPGLRDAINGTLQDSGSIKKALNGARQVVAEFPDFASGYETLTHILWEIGRKFDLEEDPLAVFRAAANAQPGNRDLQLKFVRMLLSAKRADEALGVLQDMRRHEHADPLLDWYTADALEGAGRSEEAAAHFSRISSYWNKHAGFLNSYTRHAFRMKQFDLAHKCAQRAVQVEPSNQEAWANLGTVWRLLNDPREDWLFDYEKLVGYMEVVTPPGYRDLPEFLGVLRAKLEDMHLASGEPINQSVIGGSQTPGRLFGRNDQVLSAAQDALELTVKNWLSKLPEDRKHPFLSRNQQGVQMIGSWSVCLFSSGQHSNHIHNQGWMSSAFYVSLPEAVRTGNSDQAGWIQFGAPLESLGLELAPRRLIQPKPGYLALFPSFIWHGTMPFTDKLPRVTVAFDMQPTVHMN